MRDHSRWYTENIFVFNSFTLILVDLWEIHLAYQSCDFTDIIVQE